MIFSDDFSEILVVIMETALPNTIREHIVWFEIGNGKIVLYSIFTNCDVSKF